MMIQFAMFEIHGDVKAMCSDLSCQPAVGCVTLSSVGHWHSPAADPSQACARLNAFLPCRVLLAFWDIVF